MTGNTEWWKKHRPKAFEDLVGQSTAARQLTEFVRKKAVPHALLFVGPSGCGKTTAARVLAPLVGCAGLGYQEVNASSDRGIEMVRDIQGRMPLSPMQGKSKVFVLDECHALLKPSQEALLKTLEDTPKHCYFILCTSSPDKLIAAVKTRCTQVKFGRVGLKDLMTLVRSVLAKETKPGHLIGHGEEVYERLVEAADGSARKALVLLEQVQQVTTEEEAFEVLEATDKKSQGWELAKLLHDPRSRWADAAKLIKTLDEDAEGVRRVCLAWAEKVLLGGGKLAGRAAKLIDKFQYPMHESGRPVLSLAVFQFYHEE